MNKPEHFVYWFMGATMNQLGNTSKFQRAQLCEQVTKLVNDKIGYDLIAYMINGFYEIQDGKHFDELDKQIVEHLKLIFKKVTPEVKDETKHPSLAELYEESEIWKRKFPSHIDSAIC